MQYKKLLLVLITFFAFLGAAQNSQAALNAVDPGPYVLDYGFFPVWYQDTNGMSLELCLSPSSIAADAARGLLGGPACTLLANPGIFDPALPIAFPTNFPDESFWFMGDTTLTDAATGIDLIYVSNLEAAFGGGVPLDGDQVSFARIRIRVDVPVAGTYIVTHPYGVETFEVTTPGRRAINMTRDIGIGAPGDFTGALAGDIGPFLVDASVPTLGPIPGVDPVTGSPNGEFYIGDPNTPRPVVGSPFGTNFVRIEGPGGIDVQTDLFNVMGKVFPAALATPLVIERTTYSRITDPGGTVVAQQDVFAKAPPAATVNFVDANGNTIAMTDSDANGAWFGQSASDPVLPAIIAVTAQAPGLDPATASSDLVDLVTITRAEYDGGTLVVEAASSDEVLPLPTLTVDGQIMAPVGTGSLQTVTIGGLTIPPAKVTVTSANGGSDTEEVVVLP